MLLACLCSMLSCARAPIRIWGSNMGTILQLAAALEGFKKDHGGDLPPVESLEIRSSWKALNLRYPPWFPEAWPPKDLTSVRDLEQWLCPKYINTADLFATDYWGRPFRYVAHSKSRTYVIVTFGRDGCQDVIPEQDWDPAELDRDLVYEGKGAFLGGFVSRPRGTTWN